LKNNKNKKIGILGGSFDPAHKGHIKISIEAKKKFEIDKIIWAVTRKNPFKSKKYASIVIITHKSADELLMKMISKLTKKPYIVRKPNLIRIDD